MKLITARFQNFCQYRDATFGFSPGMTMITGPNGVGKSNLISGIIAALTGDPNQTEGVKTDNISFGTPKRASSFVELALEHNGVPAEATCSFRPTKRSFNAQGMEKPITGDAHVTEAIKGFLGIDNDVLTNYVFVNQHDLFGIFSLSPAKRSATLQRLYGLEQAEKIWAKLGEALSLVPAFPAVNLDESREAVRKAEADFNIAQSVADQAQVDSLERQLTEANDAVRLFQKHKEISDAKRDAQQAVGAAVQARIAAQDAKTKAELECTAAITAAEVIPALETYVQARKQKASADSELARLTDMRAKMVQSLPPSGYLDATTRPQVLAIIDELNAKYVTAEAMVKRHAAHGNQANCPTCGQSLAGVLNVVDEAKAEMARLAPGIREAKDAVTASVNYDATVDKLKAAIESTDREIARINSTLALYTTKPPFDWVTDNDQQTQTTARNLADRRASAVAIFDVEQRKLAAAEAAEVAATNRYNQVSSVADVSIPEGGTLESALQRVSELSSRLSSVRLAIANYAIAKERLESAIDVNKKAEKTAKESRAAAVKRNGLTNLRQAFHRDGLPKVMAADMTNRLIKATNEFLEEFGPPFTLACTETGAFVARFADGNEQLAGRLSGGQRVVLSLAFRLAVHATFAANIKLICLDEPTAGLDTYNLDCLGRAFQRLGAISRAAGLQVIVVTHETAIAHFFDHVINLGQPKE